MRHASWMLSGKPWDRLFTVGRVTSKLEADRERLLRRRLDSALDEPQELIIERSTITDRHGRQLLVNGFGQSEAKLNDLAALFLTSFVHGQSLTHEFIPCQYRVGIDENKSGCYTDTVSTRFHGDRA